MLSSLTSNLKVFGSLSTKRFRTLASRAEYDRLPQFIVHSPGMAIITSIRLISFTYENENKIKTSRQ